MSKPLGFHVGYRITSLALNRIAKWDTLTADQMLGRILSTPVQRKKFQEVIQNELQTYRTQPISKLPMGARTTIDQIANQIGRMMGSLPGDSGTDDDGVLIIGTGGDDESSS